MFQTLELLELSAQADMVVGTPGVDGLSIEQRKRLTIGVELVANPSIILCDEPTSGLDAFQAETVMRVLRRIAATGRTIICTIHQPSADIFSLFDALLLMKRGGQVVFFGDLGHECANLVDYFHSFPPAIVTRIRPGTACAWLSLPCQGRDSSSQRSVLVEGLSSSCTVPFLFLRPNLQARTPPTGCSTCSTRARRPPQTRARRPREARQVRVRHAFKFL